MCTALIYSMIQHKRASHADIDLPFLVCVCVCVFGIAWTLPFPSVRLYNPNQLHMLSWFVCVCVCVYVAQISPQVFLLILSQHGRGGGLLCASTETCPTPLHTHTSPHTSKGDRYRSVSDNQRVGEIPIPRYPLRLL